MDPCKFALWGAVLGDVLGAPFEFKKKNQEEHADRIVRFNRYTKTTRTSVPRQWTDDTEMVVILTRGLALYETKHSKEELREWLILRYMEWAKTCPFMGKNTRNHFKGIKTVKGYEKRVAEQKHIEDAVAMGNGPLMRAPALARVCHRPLEEVLELARLDCALTNRNDTSLHAVCLYTTLLHQLLQEGTAYPDPLELELDDETRTLLVQDDEKCLGTDGFILHGLRIAFFFYRRALHGDGSLEDHLRAVIALGGDTDTNACIAGGLLGALAGRRGEEPSPLFEVIRNTDPIQGDFPSAPEYHPKHLDSL